MGYIYTCPHLWNSFQFLLQEIYESKLNLIFFQTRIIDVILFYIILCNLENWLNKARNMWNHKLFLSIRWISVAIGLYDSGKRCWLIRVSLSGSGGTAHATVPFSRSTAARYRLGVRVIYHRPWIDGEGIWRSTTAAGSFSASTTVASELSYSFSASFPLANSIPCIYL